VQAKTQQNISLSLCIDLNSVQGSRKLFSGGLYGGCMYGHSSCVFGGCLQPGKQFAT
jgi:hypothetical protein